MITTRLYLLAGIMIFTILINSAIAYLGFATTENEIARMYQGGIKDSNFISDVKDEFRYNILDAAKHLEEGKITSAEALEKIKKADIKISDLWETYLSNLKKENDPMKDSPTIDKINILFKENKNLLTNIQEITKKGSKEDFSAYYTKDLYPYYLNLDHQLSLLLDEHLKETSNDYVIANKNIQSEKNIILFVFLLSILLASILGFYIAKSISIPLKAAVHEINKLAAGDTSLEVQDYSKNEIGSLMNAIQKMVISSKKMAETLENVSQGNLDVETEIRSKDDTLGKALNFMKDNLRKIVGNIQTEVSALSTSGEEILASVSQASAGTAETAAAVTETTTTMEELRQTAQLSAEKAKDVLVNVEGTLDTVNTSDALLQNTILDMHQINEKMKSISDGIIRLSEHNQVIGQINDTVNDIAEQSNLLAVNAAIEAAKAGEQGKSFNVVAQEIRMLAEQSKNATIQIKTILNDIQNSTSHAVLATEQGSKAVDKGLSQALMTSQSMEVLKKSMEEVAQAAKQIDISSGQQFIGIDQVAVAINNINDASKGHVRHMKQIEDSAFSLNDIGKSLKDIVDQYKLESATPKNSRFGKFKKNYENESL